MALPAARKVSDLCRIFAATAAATQNPGDLIAAYGPYAGVVLGTENKASGDSMSLALDGLWEVDCATGTTASAGDIAWFNTSTGLIVTAGGSSIIKVGRFAKAKTSGQLKATVDLNAGADADWFPDAAQQTLAAGGGAVTLTEYYTAGASDAGGDAWTLADGLAVGQLKKIQLITDGGGDATLTPTSLAGGTTITFADAGDYCILRWNGSDWRAIELGNDADGATAPVLA